MHACRSTLEDPTLLLSLLVAWRRAGGAEAVRRALALAVLTALVSVPAIATGAVLPPTSSPLTSDTARGNLFEPLELAQLAGVWPAGDFRGDPQDLTSAYVVIAVVVILGCAGLAASAWRRQRGPLVYVLGTLVAAAAILVLGSPWVDGKALATAGPAVLLAAIIGGAAIVARGGLTRRLVGWTALGAVVAGVAWSNALAYRDANLAPYDQLAELERIGALVEGEGPALMTEYQPYGVRHFLREADPEGVSELRRRLIPLRNGESVTKGVNADTDELSPHGLLVFPTLVLRRSPVQSRPPAPYELTWRGRYYEVWQRPTGDDGPEARLALGDGLDPTGVLRCEDLRRPVDAEPGAQVTAAKRDGTVVVPLDAARHPGGWVEGERTVRPEGGGTVHAEVDLPAAGDWHGWLGGSVRGEVELFVDGRPAGSARHFLNNYGFFIDLGATELAAGSHELELRFSGADLHPGSGGSPEPVGPLILAASEPEGAELVRVHASDAGRLCGKRWDWVEIG